MLVQFDRDWLGGERLYRHALSLKPAYAQATMWLANDCLFQGRHGEALREGQHAQSLEPTSFAFASNVGMIRYFLRDYDTAIAQLASVVEAAPGAELPRRHLARVHIARRDGAEALKLVEQLPDVVLAGSVTAAGPTRPSAGSTTPGPNWRNSKRSGARASASVTRWLRSMRRSATNPLRLRPSSAVCGTPRN